VPRYVILVPKAGAKVTFAYMDPERALRKTRTSQRAGTEYTLLADDRPITDAQLEADALHGGKQ
jgi:hypothetical protein